MRYSVIALKTITRKKLRSMLTIGGVAIAVAVLVSLMGFDQGYQQALKTDIDKMGYQVLVTAKGCPYEAATLMLKGGKGRNSSRFDRGTATRVKMFQWR